MLLNCGAGEDSWEFLGQSESRSVMSSSLWLHGQYSPWNSPGQNTGEGSLSLFQGSPTLQAGSFPAEPQRKPYSKEINSVNPKGNQPWTFSGRTGAESEAPIFWWPDEELTHWKRPWCWERLKVAGEGDDRGWDGWMASSTQWIWIWANSGR